MIGQVLTLDFIGLVEKMVGGIQKTTALIAGAPFPYPLLRAFLPPPFPSPFCVCHAGYSYDRSPFCFGNYRTMLKLAGVDILYHSYHWSKFIVTIQHMSIKLIFQKYKTFIALVIKTFTVGTFLIRLIQVTTLPSTSIQIYFCFYAKRG